MNEHLAKWEADIRKDERARIAKDAAKWIDQLLNAREELDKLAQRALALFPSKSGTVEQVAQPRKAPSPKLSADECAATLVRCWRDRENPCSIEELMGDGNVNALLGGRTLTRSQVARGLKLLMEQKRVVCVNQEARRNRKFQLVKQDDHAPLTGEVANDAH